MFPLLRSILFLACGLLWVSAWATHNRAGEIIICKLTSNPLDYRYEATIITYTKISAPADRPELALDWGDGAIDTIPRFSILDDTARDLRRNYYIAVHEYVGPGQYELVMDDQNRNGGVENIPNSIQQSFTIKTTLLISPVTGHNCSVRFLNPPIQDACINQRWIHNPAAFDPDGDSLSYEPTVCLGLGGVPIAGYTYPGPNYSIDPTTGTIIWDAPTVQGEYNIAFIVREWRFKNGAWQEVGSVIRDMQITVIACTNVPPVIAQVADTCVEAGTILAFNVVASDPDADQSVTLTALGQPFVVASSPATFIGPSQGNPVTGTFNWNTVCAHVRVQPYQVVFSAIDNGTPVQLQDYRTMNITVVGPAPQNPSATPNGSVIDLAWDASVCANATGYLIYRRSGLYGFDPDHCETGVPAYTGYTLVGSTSGNAATTYQDAGGLVIGNQYCYMVVATFPDGAQSYASEEFCTILDRQVPV
ncbi:MAG: hypothetical protein KDB84_05670, partial [Flavobacteriales bacterium]|nr:hypothetical protein [Flavobacteriales bacterium]